MAETLAFWQRWRSAARDGANKVDERKRYFCSDYPDESDERNRLAHAKRLVLTGCFAFAAFAVICGI